MKTTYTRVHVYLNKEEAQALDYLRDKMHERKSVVMKRALIYYRDHLDKNTKEIKWNKKK